METTPTGNPELDDPASQFIQHCLRTPTIIRKVLEHFSNSDLLTLSLVNKEWNFEARSVLRDRADLTAKTWAYDPSKSFVAFASDLRQMRVVPFSGIHIDLYYDQSCRSNESLERSCRVILDRLPCKHLSLHLWDNLGDFNDCQALVLVQKILQRFRISLEKLSLNVTWKEETEMYQQVFQKWCFPRLKTLKIVADGTGEDFTSFVKMLVRRAPNLQTLSVSDSVHFQENILEGSSAVLVPTFKFNPLKQRVCESLFGSVRAETIEIRTHRSFEPKLRSLKRIVPMALQASRTTLKTLRMDLLFAVPLMCYGICLENVSKLEILVRSDALQSVPPRILTLLKGFDFTDVFPKLEQVEIVNNCMAAFRQDHINDFIEIGYEVLRTIPPDGAVYVTNLKLNEADWESELPFWAQMFPHVKNLLVDTGVGNISAFPFKLLWEHFVNLEELTFKSFDWGFFSTDILDSVLCGIFPEEVAQLNKKDEEYLQAVNIVPVRPSITSMKGLRTFTLEFTTLPILGHRLQMEPGPTFFCSKVTALTCFARCPGLFVTFKNELHSRVGSWGSGIPCRKQ